MRPLFVLLVLSAFACAPSNLFGQSPRQQLPSRATIAVHHYRYVEYPRQVRGLEHAIRLRRAEIASLERQLEEWGPLDRFRNGRQLFITIENTRLLLLDARFDLERMEQDLYDLHRYRRYRMASHR